MLRFTQLQNLGLQKGRITFKGIVQVVVPNLKSWKQGALEMKSMNVFTHNWTTFVASLQYYSQNLMMK